MKKRGSILVIIILTWVLQACHGPVKNDGTTTADKQNAVKDTAKTLDLLVDKEDTQFAITAANASMTEVALGKLAMQKGRDKRVKNFGMMMAKEHTKVSNKLIGIAKNKNITLPTQLNGEDEKLVDSLDKASGEAFDKAYIKIMIDEHKEDVHLFTAQATNCQDPELRGFAVKTLPHLKTHLDAITAIQQSVE